MIIVVINTFTFVLVLVLICNSFLWLLINEKLALLSYMKYILYRNLYYYSFSAYTCYWATWLPAVICHYSCSQWGRSIVEACLWDEWGCSQRGVTGELSGHVYFLRYVSGSVTPWNTQLLKTAGTHTCNTTFPGFTLTVSVCQLVCVNSFTRSKGNQETISWRMETREERCESFKNSWNPLKRGVWFSPCNTGTLPMHADCWV